MGLTILSTLPPNLLQGLKALRSRRKQHHVWVNNLCINQENIEEKIGHVAIRDEIYAHARHVCVWLGEASESSRIAMDFIKQDATARS